MFTYISSYFWYALGYTENSKDNEMEILKDKVNKLEELILENCLLLMLLQS